MKTITNILMIFWLSLAILATASPSAAIEESDLVQGINSYRRTNGLSALKVSPNLEKSSEKKLQDMQKYLYWSHDNPVTRTKWSSFIYLAGAKGIIGENLARNFDDANKVVMGWVSSPTHRDNLLSRDYHKLGISIGTVDYQGKSATVIVANFSQ